MNKDNLNELARHLHETHKEAEAALDRVAPHVPLTEVVRGLFDDVVPFTMEFKTYRQFKTTLLELQFFGPPPLGACCADCYCTVCQSFNGGEQLITLARPYIAGSIFVSINNVATESFEETSPSSGLVTVLSLATPENGVTAEASELPLVKVCYLYKYVTCT
jgi:hypothetical protein